VKATPIGLPKLTELKDQLLFKTFPLKLKIQNYSEINLKKIILYQGVINPSRGLDKMIPAMEKIENAEFWLLETV
jgi:hypothetical protein